MSCHPRRGASHGGPARYSNSRTWVSPQEQARQQRIKLNEDRRQFCPKSVAWTHNMDLVEHENVWKETECRRLDAKKQLESLTYRECQDLGLEAPVHIKPASGGTKFDDNHSLVLGLQTVFAHNYEQSREWPLADWPSMSEMKYEGDDRRKTDPIQGRTLGAPRMPGNATVNWQKRSIVPQYALESYHGSPPDEFDIFFRIHHIPELQFDEFQLLPDANNLYLEWVPVREVDGERVDGKVRRLISHELMDMVNFD